MGIRWLYSSPFCGALSLCYLSHELTLNCSPFFLQGKSYLNPKVRQIWKTKFTLSQLYASQQTIGCDIYHVFFPYMQLSLTQVSIGMSIVNHSPTLYSHNMIRIPNCQTLKYVSISNVLCLRVWAYYLSLVVL